MKRPRDVRPRRVLYVMDTFGVSGRTKGIFDLALHLDPKRFEPVFCALGDETSALVERLRDRSLPVEIMRVAPGLRPEGVGNLIRLIRRHGVAVVHAVNPRPLLYAGLAARMLRIRSTVGSLSAFACQIPDREYAFLPAELVNRGRRQAWRNQIASDLVNHLVVVSDELGDRFCRFTSDGTGLYGRLRYRALRRKMHTISYGIDLAPFQAVAPRQVARLRGELGMGEDAILIGSVGRLVEQKDYPTQLRAFAMAAAVEPRLRMVLAGDGPLRGDLEALVRELRIQERVTFVGHWNRVPEFLRAIDVFVIASKFEPYGVALLEAKCAGVAIVATAVNEIPNLLADGKTGIVVAAESPDEMARAFVRLARDRSLREALGNEALAEAKQKHTIEAVAESYQALYETPAH